MRTNRAAVLTVACITGILGLAAPTVASADSSTIYVNSFASAHCSDTGTGTQAQPFCTLTAADSAAQPGQTIQVLSDLNEAVQITKSGLPGQPITIKGLDNLLAQQPDIDGPAGQPALTLTGVHDVVVDGLIATGSATNSIVVKDSSQVILDHNHLAGGPNTSSGLQITGQSNHVSVTRSFFAYTRGITVDPQVQNTTIAGNDLQGVGAGSIRVDSAPGTAVTNNTVAFSCGAGIALLGTSTGATVENNIVIGDAYTCPADVPDSQIAVSAGSVAQSKVDYNIVHAPTGHPDYNWAGTGYTSVADFQSHTQQGTHDLDFYVVFNTLPAGNDRLTDADIPAIKSADPNAPGIPATDMLGYGPIDDPKVPTPANGNLLDRGAYQLEGLTRAVLVATGPYGFPQGPAPFTATYNVEVTNTWPTKLTYTYDFGDGSTQTSDQPTVTHVYNTPGSYRATVTVTDSLGGKVTNDIGSVVRVAAADATLQPSLTVKPWSNPLGFSFDAMASSSPYGIANYAFDFGDGSTGQGDPVFTHTYAQPGTYNVTLTVTDESGKSAQTTQQVVAAYNPAGYVALAPTRVLDTRTSAQANLRLGAGATANVHVNGGLDGSNPVPYGATAVVLNLTATGGTDDSFLTAYPTGTKVPTASNVNFKPGQDVSNVVTIPVSADGTINVYNHVGTVDVVADVLGYYKPSTGSNYTPAAPTRLLDTRTTNAPLGQGGDQSLQVAGTSTVPANATAVALNVTATQGTDDSFLTVYPTGQQRPAQASNVNFKAGTDTGNQVIVPVGQNGSVDIFNHIGSVHAVVDVFGYYSPDSQGKFVPVVPQRLMDTRQQPNHALGADSAFSISGVPASASAAVLNVTAVDGTDSSFLTVYGANSPRPGTSNLNFGPGQTVPNEVITPVNNGSFSVYNHVGSTDVITDLFGYFTNN